MNSFMQQRYQASRVEISNKILIRSKLQGVGIVIMAVKNIALLVVT